MNENAVFKLLPKNPTKMSTLGNTAGSNRSKQRDEPIEIPSNVCAVCSRRGKNPAYEVWLVFASSWLKNYQREISQAITDSSKWQSCNHFRQSFENASVSENLNTIKKITVNCKNLKFRFLCWTVSFWIQEVILPLVRQPQRLPDMCTWEISGVFNGVRTHDPWDAGAVLWPTELWSHSSFLNFTGTNKPNKLTFKAQLCRSSYIAFRLCNIWYWRRCM